MGIFTSSGANLVRVSQLYQSRFEQLDGDPSVSSGFSGTASCLVGLYGSGGSGASCPIDRMPPPGDHYAQAFTVEPGQCWAMIHDRQGQAAHCTETPSWTGRWFSPSGDRWWRVWACPDHLDGLTGLREFGRRRN